MPLIETRIVPVTVPKRRPADIVNGMAGIASIYSTDNNLHHFIEMLIHVQELESAKVEQKIKVIHITRF